MSSQVKVDPDYKQEDVKPSLDQLFSPSEPLEEKSSKEWPPREYVKDEEVLNGALTLKSDSEGNALLTRTPTMKKKRPEPILWGHLPSAKNEASLAFQELEQCHYQPGYLGESGQEEMMTCDCKPEYGRDLSYHSQVY
jgi:hypothetical protein